MNKFLLGHLAPAGDANLLGFRIKLLLRTVLVVFCLTASLPRIGGIGYPGGLLLAHALFSKCLVLRIVLDTRAVILCHELVVLGFDDWFSGKIIFRENAGLKFP